MIAVVGLILCIYVNNRINVRNPANNKVTDDVVFACIYISILLALVTSTVSGITHSGVLVYIASRKRRSTSGAIEDAVGRQQTLQAAIDEIQSHDDALYWFVCFICPSLITMVMAMMIFVWTDHALGVAISLSVALFYCVVQVSRVVMHLAVAATS